MTRVISAVLFSALGFGSTIGLAVAESPVYAATAAQAKNCGALAIAIREAKADPTKQVEAFQRASQYIEALTQMRTELEGEDRKAALERKEECKKAIGVS